ESHYDCKQERNPQAPGAPPQGPGHGRLPHGPPLLLGNCSGPHLVDGRQVQWDVVKGDRGQDRGARLRAEQDDRADQGQEVLRPAEEAAMRRAARTALLAGLVLLVAPAHALAAGWTTATALTPTATPALGSTLASQ